MAALLLAGCLRSCSRHQGTSSNLLSRCWLATCQQQTVTGQSYLHTASFSGVTAGIPNICAAKSSAGTAHPLSVDEQKLHSTSFQDLTCCLQEHRSLPHHSLLTYATSEPRLVRMLALIKLSCMACCSHLPVTKLNSTLCSPLRQKRLLSGVGSGKGCI